MSRAHIAVVVLAGVLAGAAASHFARRAASARPELEHAVLFQEPRPIPLVALVDQAGGKFDSGRLKGRWTFLFFGFVNCPDICPTTLATLAAARREFRDLAPSERPEVAFVSVDPGRDTPADLARYVAHFDASFSGLTGSREAIDALARALGVAVIIGPPTADGDYALDHSASVFLVDPAAHAAALFSTPHETGAIARDFRRIVAARRDG